MTEDVPADTTHQPITSKKQKLLDILEIWRESKRDPLEFSQRIANISFEDLNTEETAP
jgi:hypothetical protein